MGKYGKKKEINLNPLAYNIGLIGEPGVGKTTLMKEVCEKLAGDDGYIFLEMGHEDGANCINGIISESIDDWAKFKDVLNDIIENKQTDYPNLKTIVIDTYDELIPLCEKEAIRQYNKKLQAEGKTKIDSINQVAGGFGRGLDVVVEMIIDSLWELKKVGVAFILIMHTKRREIEDSVTGESYSILTSNTTQKYFNAVKTKLDFLGCCYINREIVKEKTGKKDVKGNDVIKGKIAGESRVISFRDNTYSVDSKCRFANIVDNVVLDSDAFIKALQDAILSEQSKSGVPVEDAKKKQMKEADEKEKAAMKYSKSKTANRVDLSHNDCLIAWIKNAFLTGSEDMQTAIRIAMRENGVENFKDNSLPTAAFEAIAKAAGISV